MLSNVMVCLVVLRDMYHSGHWFVKGPLFYSDHLILERLYKSSEKHIDAVAEMIIGKKEDKKCLYPSEIYKKAYEKTKPFNPDMKDNVEIYKAIKLHEDMLKNICEEMDKDDKTCPGVKNLIGDIAQDSEERCYLIYQRIGMQKENKQE